MAQKRIARGRPRKVEDNRLNRTLHIMVGDAMFARINAEARRRKSLTRADVVRELLHKGLGEPAEADLATAGRNDSEDAKNEADGARDEFDLLVSTAWAPPSEADAGFATQRLVIAHRALKEWEATRK